MQWHESDHKNGGGGGGGRVEAGGGGGEGVKCYVYWPIHHRREISFSTTSKETAFG